MELQLDTSHYYNSLDTTKFSGALNDPSESYKFYWLGGIVNLLKTGRLEFTFEEIIDEMICDAWYSVTHYHLRLGTIDISGNPQDLLERIIDLLQQKSGLSSKAPKSEILKTIEENRQDIISYEKRLVRYVPYRILSKFLTELSGNNSLWESRKRLIAYIAEINKVSVLPYIIRDGVSLNKSIIVDNEWRNLIIDNYQVIQSWIAHKKIQYLQSRNPNVPGLVNKLDADDERNRKLQKVRRLWTDIMDISDVRDIYTGKQILKNAYDIDHFIPWSYVSHDELWNLSPADKWANGSKNNRLPDWEKYFLGLCQNQYQMYSIVFKYPRIREDFERCRVDNLNSIWAQNSLYIEGNSYQQFSEVLEHHMRQVYEDAMIQGYDIWEVPDSAL